MLENKHRILIALRAYLEMHAEKVIT
jgi:hypothetical protein